MGGEVSSAVMPGGLSRAPTFLEQQEIQG